MTAMSFLAVLMLTGSVTAAPPPVTATPPVVKPPVVEAPAKPVAPPPTAMPQATAIGVARARILAPAEVRRIDGRLQVIAGDRRAPTQVHRTERADGGETADFY